MTTPAPSPRTKPLARASKLLQRPSGDSIDALQNPMLPSGRTITFTPAANASSISPFQMPWHAKSTATSEDEHAVSTARLGPTRSKKYEIRLAAIQSAEPRLV